MPVSIAGASNKGARLASAVDVSASSARPSASRAIVWAVAGATINKSASRPMVTCRIWPVPEDHISVVTGRPVSAEK